MPIALVRSISLPNLKVYTTISLLLVSGCLYYAFDVVRTDPQWKLHHNTSHHSSSRPASLLKSSNDAIAVLTNSELLSSLTSSLTSSDDKKGEERADQHDSVFEEANLNDTSSFANQLKDVASFMTHEPVCIWVSGCFFFFFLATFSLSSQSIYCDKITSKFTKPYFDSRESRPTIAKENKRWKSFYLQSLPLCEATSHLYCGDFKDHTISIFSSGSVLVFHFINK